jgi:histone-lysine N-methyltransferase SETDB1
LQYFTPRDQVITQRLYRPHNCSPSCKDYVRHNLGKLRGHNPLSKPLLCGWARITQKVKGRKEIVYKAPCSRILRNMQEVHRYLRMTKSEMTVDLFDFNHMVRCLAEFNVECIPDPKDLSKGTAALTWGLSFLLSCFKA